MRGFAALALVAVLAACQTAETPPRPVTASASAVARPAAGFTGIDRPRAVANKDDALKSVLSRRIADLGRPFRAVSVEVWGGRALLMGAVIKPEQRRKAEQVAASLDGVVSVHNELVLAEDKALEVFVADPAREDEVRQALGIEGRNGTIVRVINGVAFLLGGAPSAEAIAAMKADAAEVAGVKWVVSHLQAP